MVLYPTNLSRFSSQTRFSSRHSLPKNEISVLHPTAFPRFSNVRWIRQQFPTILYPTTSSRFSNYGVRWAEQRIVLYPTVFSRFSSTASSLSFTNCVWYPTTFSRFSSVNNVILLLSMFCTLWHFQGSHTDDIRKNDRESVFYPTPFSRFSRDVVDLDVLLISFVPCNFLGSQAAWTFPAYDVEALHPFNSSRFSIYFVSLK